MFIRTMLLFVGFGFLFGCAIAPKKPVGVALGDYAYTKQYISWLIEKEVKKQDVTGVSIALVDDQKVVWAQGFGYADKANNIPATADTVYRLGSISKVLTATAAMQLAERGKIDIDKPLKTYLPEFSIKTRFPDTAPITPRNIMTHHSGLPANLIKGMWTKDPEPFIRVVDEIKNDYVAYPPNYVFAYSNLGVTLLGAMIERVSGEDYSAYMNHRLLQPMGMIHSSFTAKPDVPLMSKAYSKGKEVEEMPLRDVPAGGLNSSVIDMSRFMEMIFAEGKSGENQIIRPETLTEMLTPKNLDVPLDLNFRIGLGWMLGGLGGIDIQNAGPVAHHNGGTFNFMSQMIVLPKHKLGVIVLSNSASGARVVSEVATKALKLALEAKTGIKQPKEKKPAIDPTPLSPKTLQTYVGDYATMVGLVKVSDKSSQLRAEAMGKTFQLEHRSDGQFGLKYKLLGLIPISLGDLGNIGFSRATIEGRDVLIGSENNQSMLIGEKIKPVPIPQSWLNRVGEYTIIDRGDNPMVPDKISLRYEDSLLVFESFYADNPKMPSRTAIYPVSDNEAVIAGLGSGMGETIWVIPAGNEEIGLFSGLELKKQNEAPAYP